MAYLGTPIDTRNQFQSLQGKRFNGDGSTTAFTLDVAPSSTLDIEVFVGNVRQDPNSAYTLSGTTLSFTGAPPSGTNNIYVVHQAKSVGTIDVPDSYKSDSQTISGARTFNGGITMGGTTPTLTIGDAGAEDTKIVFDGNAQDYHIGLDDSSDDLVIGLGSTLGTTSYLNIDEAGEISTGGETAPDVDSGGITINHGANDTNTMTFKNSDVAHGMTTNAETDTYAEFTKGASAQGGFRIRGLSDSSGYSGLDLFGDMGGASNTGEATHVNGVIHIDGAIKDGTDRGAMGADENTVCIKNAGTTEVIFKGDGEIFSNQSATVGTFDAYEDAQLIRAYDLSHMRGVINSKFDKFVQYNQKDLADARLIGKDENGNPTSFVNWTGMSRLHNGAIWQQYEKHNQLLEAVYDLAKEAVGEEKANAILDKHEIKRLQ